MQTWPEFLVYISKKRANYSLCVSFAIWHKITASHTFFGLAGKAPIKRDQSKEISVRQALAG